MRERSGPRDGPLAIKLAYEELYSKTIAHGDAIAEVHRSTETTAGSALSPAKQLRSSITAGAREVSPAKLDICSTSNSLTPSAAGRSYGGASAQPMSYAARHSRALASQRASAEKVACAIKSPSGRPPPSPTRSSTASAVQSKPSTNMGRTASAVVAALAVDAALPDLDAQALALLEAIMSPSTLPPPTPAEEPVPENGAPASSALASNCPASPRTGAKLSASIRAAAPASYAAMSHSRNHAPVATVGQEQLEQQDSPQKSARALSAPSAVCDDGGNAENTEVEKQPQCADGQATAGAPRHTSAAGAACGVGTGGQKLAVARLSYDVPCGTSMAASALGMRLEEAVLDGSTKGPKRLDNGTSTAGSAAGCMSGAASSTTVPPTGPANTSAPGAAGQPPSGARAIIRRMCRSHAGRNTSSRSLRGEDGWRPTYTELEGFRLGTTPAAPPQPLPESPSAPASGALPKSPLGSATVAAAAAAIAAACLPVGGSEELEESSSGSVPVGIVTAPGVLVGGATPGAFDSGAGSQGGLVAIREVASIHPAAAADPRHTGVPANGATKQPRQQPKAKAKPCFSLFGCFGVCAGATAEDTGTSTAPPAVKAADVAHAPADGGTIAAARYPEPSSPQAIFPSTPNAEALELLPHGDIIATLDAAAGLPSHPSLPTSSPSTSQVPQGLTAPRPRGSTSPGGHYHHHSHRSTGGKPMLHSPQHHSARGTLLGPGRPSGSQFPSRTTTPRKLSTQPGGTAGGAASPDLRAATADGSAHKGTGGGAASMLPGPIPSAEPHLPSGFAGRSSRGGRPAAAASSGSNASGSRGVSPRTHLSEGPEAAEAGLASSAEGGQGATYSRASVESARPSLRQPRGSGSGAGYAALPSYRGPLGAARAVDLGASSLGGGPSPANSRPRSRSRLQHTMSDALYAAAAALAPSDAASVDSRRVTFSPRETRSPRVSAHTGATYAAAAAAAAIAREGAAATTAPMSTGGIANDAAAPGLAATSNLGTTAQLTAQLPPPVWPHSNTPTATPQPLPAPAASAASPASAAPTPVLPSSAPPAMAGVSRRSRKRTRIPHPCGSSLAQLDARKLASMSLEQMLEEIQAAIWADDVARGRTPSVAPGGISASLPALASAVRLTGGVSASGRAQLTRRSTAGGRPAGRSIGGSAGGGGGTSAGGGGGGGVGVQSTPMKAVSAAPVGVSPLLGPSASRRRRMAWSRSPSIGARNTAAAGAVDIAGGNKATAAVTSLTPTKPTAGTVRPTCASAPSSSTKPTALRSSSPGPLGTAARSRSPPPGRWSATPPHRTTSPSPPRFSGLPPASPGSGAPAASQRVWKHGGRALGPALSAAAVGSSLSALPSASPGTHASGDKHPLRQSPYKKALRAPPGSMEAAVAAALASPAQNTSPAPHPSASPASKGTTTPPTACQPDATSATHNSARMGSVGLALPPQLMSSTLRGSSAGTASSTAAARMHPVDAPLAPPPQPAATAPAPPVCSTLDLSQLLRACDASPSPTPAASANSTATAQPNGIEDRNSSKDLSAAAGPPIGTDPLYYEGLDKDGKLSHASSATVLPTEEEVFRTLAHLVMGQGKAGGPVVEVSEGPQEEQHQALQRPAVVVVQHMERLAPGPGNREPQHEWAPGAGESLLTAVPGRVGSNTMRQQQQQGTSAVTLTELLGQVLAGEELAATAAGVYSGGQRSGHSHRGSRGNVEDAVAGMLLAPGKEECPPLQPQPLELDTTEAAAAAVPHSSGGSGSDHMCTIGSVEQEASRPGPELEAVEVAAVGVGLTRSLGSIRGALEQARLLEQVQLMQRVTITAARSQGGAPSGRPLLPPPESELDTAEECGVFAAAAVDGPTGPLDPSCLAVAEGSGAEAVRSPFQDATGAAAAVLAALSNAQLQSGSVRQQKQQQPAEGQPAAGAHVVGRGVLLGVHGVHFGADSCSVGGGTLEYHAALSPRTSAGQDEPLSPVEPREVVGA